jgi:hypothetical protein
MKTFTTEKAADAAGISRATVQVWIAANKLAAPAVQLVEGKAVRLWNADDIKKLIALKAEIYRKGRGRKPKGKPKRGGKRGK